jgi:hypothetical protein
LEPLELLRLELAGRDGGGEGLGRRFIVAV